MLLRVADEVAQCRRIVARIETVLAPLIASGAVDGAAPQAIDLLDQSLADLAICAAGLANSLPEETMIASAPVLSLLRLDDLRWRLTGEKSRAEQPVAGIALLF